MDFAARLNWLFENRLNDKGMVFKNTDVARGMGKSDFSISNAYIGKLKAGTSKPSWEVVGAFAQFFGVPVTFFYQTHLDEAYLQCFKAALLLHGDELALQIATQLPKLKPVTKQALLEIIKELQGVADKS